MSDKDGKKTLGLGGSRPSNVKQSFSHGRTKNVVVETKRKRVVVPKPGAAKPATSKSSTPVGGDPSKRPAGISEAELERRMKALAVAKARERCFRSGCIRVPQPCRVVVAAAIAPRANWRRVRRDMEILSESAAGGILRPAQMSLKVWANASPMRTAPRPRA